MKAIVTHRTATPKLNRVATPTTSRHGKLTVDTVKIWGTHDEVCQITKLRSNKLIIKKWTDRVFLYANNIEVTEVTKNNFIIYNAHN